MGKNMKISAILKRLKKGGWVQSHQVGSHKQFKHPTKKGKVTINGNPSDVIDGMLLASVEKQSGIKF